MDNLRGQQKTANYGGLLLVCPIGRLSALYFVPFAHERFN